MTMLAVRSPPARGVARPADRHQGDGRRHAERPRPSPTRGRPGWRGRAAPSAAAARRGRGQAPPPAPTRRLRSGVWPSRSPSPPGPARSPRSSATGVSARPDAPGRRRAPTTPATTRATRRARAAVGRGRGTPPRRRSGSPGATIPPVPHGRSHDQRRQRHQAEHSERRREGEQPRDHRAADRGPSAPGVPPATGPGARPTPKVKTPPDGWPSWESTRHSTRMLPAPRACTGATTARARRGSRRAGPGHDAPVGVEHPEREERLLHGRREHQAHGGGRRLQAGARPRARTRPASNGPTRPPARRRSRPVPRRATGERARSRRYQPAPRPSAGHLSSSAGGARR